MRRTWPAPAGLVALLALAAAARGLVTRPTHLRDMLAEATFIIAAKVESLDEKRPAMVLAAEDALKGKPGWAKLPVLLEGDARAKKLKEPPQLLKRLAAKQPLVLFVTKLEPGYAAFAFTNGTWFSLTGTTVDGEVRWSFNHLEPYLRRTYGGTTAEMIATVKDALAGKRKPPPYDEKVKPGLGPEVESKKTGRVRLEDVRVRRGVIPTVLVGGPLALLALLFPTAFGGWQRWLALLSTAGTNLTLVSLQWWFADALVGSWWGTPQALWTAMTALSLVGAVWAWNRHTRAVQLGEAPLLAGRVEVLALLAASLVGVATLLVCKYLQQPLSSPVWLPVVAFVAAIWAGTLYVGWTWMRGARLVPAKATEAVVLTGLALACAVLAPALPARGMAGGLEGGETTQGATRVELVWTFKLPDKGAIASSPLAAGERVYVAAAHDSVFHPYGALYCLDRATGRPIWAFHDGKKMKQVFSSPVVVEGRLYIGEGFHQDDECKVYCLDAATGKKLWERPTRSHTEATPFVAGGRVYIGAGDDGLYCLDAATGDKVWNFPGFHIDASPVVVGDRVYAGCGLGEEHKTTAVFCLDARTGKPRWRVHTSLPVWGRPAVSGGAVYVGTGNGRLNESAEKPAGELLCLRADDGETIWRKALSDGVLAPPSLDRERVYVGCRDRSFYALWRRDGGLAWKRDLGSPVVAGAALEGCACCESVGRLYVAGSAGVLVCLEPATGALLWSKDLVERTKVQVEVIATPALEARGGARRLYVALTAVSTARAGELHCYEERAAKQE
jgi:outer membrane protein assembly factor BamB